MNSWKWFSKAMLPRGDSRILKKEVCTLQKSLRGEKTLIQVWKVGHVNPATPHLNLQVATIKSKTCKVLVNCPQLGQCFPMSNFVPKIGVYTILIYVEMQWKALILKNYLLYENCLSQQKTGAVGCLWSRSGRSSEQHSCPEDSVYCCLPGQCFAAVHTECLVQCQPHSALYV